MHSTWNGVKCLYSILSGRNREWAVDTNDNQSVLKPDIQALLDCYADTKDTQWYTPGPEQELTNYAEIKSCMIDTQHYNKWHMRKFVVNKLCIFTLQSYILSVPLIRIVFHDGHQSLCYVDVETSDLYHIFQHKMHEYMYCLYIRLYNLYIACQQYPHATVFRFHGFEVEPVNATDNNNNNEEDNHSHSSSSSSVLNPVESSEFYSKAYHSILDDSNPVEDEEFSGADDYPEYIADNYEDEFN